MSDEILDYCNNRMPARVVRLAEHASAGDAPAKLELYIEGLVDERPNEFQWDAIHDIARRFGLEPGETRWQPGGKDARGRNTGAFIMQYRRGHGGN